MCCDLTTRAGLASAAMPDRVHRARGRRRREVLLRAALEVIAERGVGGTTHRAVAQVAEVPVATTTYYFSSLDELLEAALELYVEDEVARVQEVSTAVLEHEGTPQEIIAAVAEHLANTRSTPQFELYVEAARRPALRPAVVRSIAAYRSLAEDVLRRVGARDPELAAPFVVALTDGLAVQDAAVGEPRDPERIRAALSALLASFLEGQPATTQSPL